LIAIDRKLHARLQRGQVVDLVLHKLVVGTGHQGAGVLSLGQVIFVDFISPTVGITAA
jgi:hypothetical protein